MTPEFDAYIAPARERCGLWRTFFGALLAIVFWLFASISVIGAYLRGQFVVNLGFDQPSLVIFLLTFIGLIIGTGLAASALHKRNLWSVFGDLNTARADFAEALPWFIPVYLGVTALQMLIYGFDPHLGLGQWLIWLPVLVLALGIQTLSEELFFRGYLLQQLGARFNRFAPAIFLSTLIFVALHWTPGQDSSNLYRNLGLIGLFALLAGDLVRRKGNLGAAWAFHFVNNFSALLIVGQRDATNGGALYVSPFSFAEPLPNGIFLLDGCAMLVSWFLFVRFSR